MKQFKHILLLTAFAFTVSVSATASYRHGDVKEPTKKECPYLTALGTTSPQIQIVANGAGPSGLTLLTIVCIDKMPMIIYDAPLRSWTHVDVIDPIYSAPYVKAVDAFYARSSC
jgi:hypothetical protein